MRLPETLSSVSEKVFLEGVSIMGSCVCMNSLVIQVECQGMPCEVLGVGIQTKLLIQLSCSWLVRVHSLPGLGVILIKLLHILQEVAESPLLKDAHQSWKKEREEFPYSKTREREIERDREREIERDRERYIYIHGDITSFKSLQSVLLLNATNMIRNLTRWSPPK